MSRLIQIDPSAKINRRGSIRSIAKKLQSLPSDPIVRNLKRIESAQAYLRVPHENN